MLDCAVVKFIHLENITKDYEKACSMDVKIGLIRIPPGATARTEEQEVNILYVSSIIFKTEIGKSTSMHLLYGRPNIN